MNNSALRLALIALAACSADTRKAPEANSSKVVPGPSIADLAVPEKFPVAAHEVLASATEFEIFATHPYPNSREEGGLAEAELLYGFSVLSQATVSDVAVRHDIVSVLYAGVEANKGMQGLCFLPRHAIRARSGEQTVEVMICFQCYSISVNQDGESLSVLIDRSAAAPLTKIWEDAGVTVHTAEYLDEDEGEIEPQSKR